MKLRYRPGDLIGPAWPDSSGNEKFDGVLAFASLHHIPGRENHLRIFRQIHELLRPDGRFVLSVWQFQNSPKLMSRVQPWSLTGIAADTLEKGDTLLDWRYALQDNVNKTGLRYVHLFSEAELEALAAKSGFIVSDHFYSDGAEGNLALYYELKRKQ